MSSWTGIVQVAAGYLHTQVMCATRRRGVADVISQHVSNNVSESKAQRQQAQRHKEKKVKR